MQYIPLKDADIGLVEIRGSKPYCIKHGAMNKLTGQIWRCVASYAVLDSKLDLIRENDCRAGCQEAFKCHKCGTLQVMKKVKTGDKHDDWCFWCPNCQDRIARGAVE